MIDLICFLIVFGWNVYMFITDKQSYIDTLKFKGNIYYSFFWLVYNLWGLFLLYSFLTGE